MFDPLFRSNRFFQIGLALAVVAVAGWGTFALSAWSSSEQIAVLTAERDAAVANYQKLEESGGKLQEVGAKLRAGQQELAALTKQLDETRDRVSQTGSVRTEPSKPAKGKARKP